MPAAGFMIPFSSTINNYLTMRMELLNFTVPYTPKLRVFLCASLLYLCCIIPGYSQTGHTVTGIVMDVNNQPLIGVTILEVGTTNGTVTDIDGNYSVRVESGNATLRFTYIGYEEQHVDVNNRATINVVLSEETSILDEVVVVGFGTQKRVNLTGS